MFDMRLLNKGDPWDPGFHKINIDFTRPGRSFSKDPQGRSANDDSDTTYVQVVDGTFYESDMSVGTWAHEIGHLIGLGDDYYNEHGLGHQAYDCVPGRETSLMCHSDDRGTIDQDLADRLADVVNKANRLPQCWKGTLQAHAQGNIYNDTADSRFSFTVSPDGTIKGKASVKMSHAPATMPGGCIFTRSQDPEEFDVSIDGLRNGDDFELNFGIALATYTITTQCQGHSGTGSAPGMDAFMGGSDIVLRDDGPASRGGPAKVPAQDGSTSLHGSYGGDQRATATIQIECASCTPGPRLMK